MRAAVADLPATAHPRRVIEETIAEREGRLEEALELTEGLHVQLLELGLRAMVTAPMTARAVILRKLGRLREAVEAFEEVIAIHESLGQDAYRSTTLIDYGDALYAGGDLDGAERLAIEGERLGGPDDVVNFSKGRALRARVAADRGDHDAALDLALSAAEHGYRTDFPSVHGEAHETLAHVHLKAGRVDEARSEYERALAIWERYGWTANAAGVRELLVEL
jgi:tetratricopeptide (TPR) repeat protein